MKKKTKRCCVGIIARLGSKRLHNKHLIKINGDAIIGFLIKRLQYYFRKNNLDSFLEIMILTGNLTTNQSLGIVAKQFGVPIYYGNDNNIPRRMLDAVIKHDFDTIITVDGDDIFCSPEGIKEVHDCLVNGNEYVKTTHLPFGMNSMGLTRAFLRHSVENTTRENLQTGWGWIFNDDKCKILRDSIEPDKRLRFTLDYTEDLSFFKRIIMD